MIRSTFLAVAAGLMAFATPAQAAVRYTVDITFWTIIDYDTEEAGDALFRLTYTAPDFVTSGYGGRPDTCESVALAECAAMMIGITPSINVTIGGQTTYYAAVFAESSYSFGNLFFALGSLSQPGLHEGVGFGMGSGTMLVEVLDDPVASVPEPATWASMIAGLFAIGSAMRRRVRRRIAA